VAGLLLKNVQFGASSISLGTFAYDYGIKHWLLDSVDAASNISN